MTEIHGPYLVMPFGFLTDGEIKLRAVEPVDIEAIRKWRNAQMHVLRQEAAITAEGQARYFNTHVWPEKEKSQPAQILLAIDQKGALVGYGGLVHISWPNLRAEISFLLAPEVEQLPNARSAIFGSFLNLIQEFAFSHLELHRLFTETVASREAHIETLEHAGFVIEGLMRRHMIINDVPVDTVIHGLLRNERGL